MTAPVGGFAATTRAVSPKPHAQAAATGRCSTPALRVSLVRILGAAERRDWDIALTNAGARACRVRGYPAVELVDHGLRPIGANVVRDPLTSVQTIILGPGERAVFTFIYEIAEPCLPHGFDASGLAVVPPGDSARVLLHKTIALCDLYLGGPPRLTALRKRLGYL